MGKTKRPSGEAQASLGLESLIREIRVQRSMLRWSNAGRGRARASAPEPASLARRSERGDDREEDEDDESPAPS